MNRNQAKKMAMSRDCSCIKGKDRDNNYNECIDKIFDYFEKKIQKQKSKYIPKRKFIHSPAQEISIIMDKYEATCPLERQEIIDEINARFVEKQL